MSGRASQGRALGLTIGIVSSLPLLLVALKSTQPRMGCGEQWHEPDWESALFTLGIALFCFLLGYGGNRLLARRLWSRGHWGKFVCLLPLAVTSLLSVVFGLLSAFLLSSALC